MPCLRDYHIFISHSWDYSEDYETIKSWLNNASNFRWSDYSVPVYNPLEFSRISELKLKLRNKISNCSCIIIPAAMYANSTYSKWMDFEIDTAISFGKPIIAVKPRGQERMPVKVSENAVEIVGWNSKSVVDAVRRNALQNG